MRNKRLHSIAMAKNITRTLLTGVLILAMASIALAQSLSPAIQIESSTNVEVGEEVYLSATGTTYPDAAILAKARYEWDFGDGYYLRFDPAITSITRSGIAATHFYMKPGDFTATLTVNVWAQWDSAGTPVGSPIATSTVSKVVRVTGEEPMAGFEIQRAPFHNRLAQYLYVQIPEAHRENLTALRVTLEGAKGSRNVLLSKSNLAGEERILLDHKPLAQDDYVVIAELLTSDNQRISGGLWRDKFSKRYEGIPKVGIDENNSFRVNGELFFPIGPFMTDEPKIKNFVDQAGINMLNTEGYYTSHTPATWSRYLEQAKNNNLLAIGPGRGDYMVNASPNRWKFNHNPDRMAEYVRLNKDHPAMFAWIWQDEPNMGGRAQKTYPPTLAAWAYVSHREDPQHPAYNAFYGYDWTKYYGTKPTVYDYLSSASLFGGKKWVQDVFSFDIYPIAARLHPSLNFTDIGTYAAYLDALDRIHTNNKNLVPVLPALMSCVRRPTDPDSVTEEQVYSEAWMNVIHGAKGIVWFPYFDQENTGRWAAMKKFADQMKRLSLAVLQPESVRTITDDANTPLNRVDTLVREKDGSIYIFTARVTEPNPIEKAKYQGVEPESITVNFSVSDLAGNAVATVVDEGRKVSLADGQFKDTFIRNAVHIYKIATALNNTP